MSTVPRTFRLIAATLALGMAAGCGGDGDGGTGPNPGSISISVSPGSLTLTQGESGEVTVTLNRSGDFSGSVALSTQNAPTGVTVSGGSVAAGSTSATLTVTAGANATVGSATITVRGTGSGVTDAVSTFSLTVNVSDENGFNPSVGISSLNVVQGGSGQATINVNRASGYTGTVTFSASNVPAGITATFDPVAVTGASTELTVDVDGSVAPGDYSITINADAGSAQGVSGAQAAAAAAAVTKSVTLSITVSAEPDPGFVMGLSETAITVEQGGQGSVTVDITRSGGFTGAVALALSGGHDGMTLSADPASVTGTQSTVTVQVDGGVAPGSYTVTITGSGEGVDDQSLELTVDVVIPPGFTLGLNTSQLTIEQGMGASATLVVTRQGAFSGPVSVTVSGQPAGMTAVSNPASVAGAQSSIEVNVGAGVAVGAYPLTIDASGDGVTAQSAQLTINVTQMGGGGGGDITFSFCEQSEIPVWAGYQQSGSAWMAVANDGMNNFSFSMEGRGAVAWTILDEGSAFTQVYYGTAAFFQAIGGGFCEGDGTVETLTGSVTGLVDMFHSAQIHFAGSTATAGGFGSPNFTLDRAHDITSDLLAIQNSFTTGAAVNGIRQVGLNPMDMASLGVLNFAGATAMANGMVTIENLGGDVASHTVMMYNTDRGLAGTIESPFTPTATTPRAFRSLPAGLRETGDVQMLSVQAVTGLGALDHRTASVAFQDGTVAQTVTLGPPMGPVTLSTVAAAPPAPGVSSAQNIGIRAQYDIQFEYKDFLSMTLNQSVGETDNRGFLIFILGDYLDGASTLDITTPNLVGVGGYLEAWGLVPGVTVNGSISGTGYSAGAYTPELPEGQTSQSASDLFQYEPGG